MLVVGGEVGMGEAVGIREGGVGLGREGEVDVGVEGRWVGGGGVAQGRVWGMGRLCGCGCVGAGSWCAARAAGCAGA